jgi:hypothetical protein
LKGPLFFYADRKSKMAATTGPYGENTEIYVKTYIVYIWNDAYLKFYFNKFETRQDFIINNSHIICTVYYADYCL